MSSDDTLFGDDGQDGADVPARQAESGIADWQVKSLRKALDDAGLIQVSDRQTLIEEIVGRPLASLRELSSSEARLVAERLASRTAKTGGGSSWDSREEDTWIDRL